MTLLGNQVRAILLAAGIAPGAIVELSDAVYRTALADWLCGDFHDWFLSKALSAFGVSEYQPESGDCDDFVDLFCAFARIAHRRTPEGKACALPIGRINFPLVPRAPLSEQRKHALVWAITADRGLIFPEPQVLYRCEQLTQEQLAACTRCSD